MKTILGITGTDTYRIDNDYENIYKIAEDGKSYEFYASFARIGITNYMSENEQLAIIKEDALNDSQDKTPWGMDL